MPNVNDDRPGVNGMEVTATRGGGNQTAAERVADLLTSDHDGAFKKEEAASRAARTQWTPAGAEYGEYLQHEHGTGHGPTISQPPGGFGSVSVPDNHRVVHHSNAPPPEAEVKLDGPASQTKDWRTEGSRIGRYWANDKFQVQPNGTWNFEKK